MVAAAYDRDSRCPLVSGIQKEAVVEPLIFSIACISFGVGGLLLLLLRRDPAAAR